MAVLLLSMTPSSMLRDERRDERVVERRRRQDERLLGEDDDADAVGLAPPDEVDEHVLGDVDARGPVLRARARRPGPDRRPARPSPRAIEPGEVEHEDDVDALLFFVLAAQDALRAPEREHGEHQRRAAQDAGRVAQRRPPAARPDRRAARWSAGRGGERARRPRASSSRRRTGPRAARRRARRTTRRERARRACRPSTDARRAAPGHAVHFALQPRLAAREHGPDEREREHRERRQRDERARGTSASSLPSLAGLRAGSGLAPGRARSSSPGMVARTIRSASSERALALLERRRQRRELHEVALLEKARDLGQRARRTGAARLSAASVSSVVDSSPSKPKRAPEVLAHRVVHAIEEVARSAASRAGRRGASRRGARARPPTADARRRRRRHGLRARVSQR